jgi:hypothetical protein
MHLPWSKGATNDDKIATSIENLIGAPIVITEKIDGSNTSLEREGCFARTHSGPPNHPSFNGLKALHAALKYKIPAGIQFFGEWCYALHSIAYDALPGYFLMFGVREYYAIEDFSKAQWYSWDDVELMANNMGLPTVPVLFTGTVSSEKELKELTESFMIERSVCGGIREGVVVRVQRDFKDEEFSSCIMKCVRANHVTTDEHWAHKMIVTNKLKLK